MSEASKTHKSTLRKILFTICIMLFTLIGIVVVVLLSQQPKDLQISNVAIATISNGVYAVSADNGLVKATVSVEVNDGKILNISILEHEQLLGKKAEKITESIIAQQTLEVDAISSATYSSDTLRKAVENALRQGERK